MALDRKLKAILEEARANDLKDDESKYSNPYTRSNKNKKNRAAKDSDPEDYQDDFGPDESSMGLF